MDEHSSSGYIILWFQGDLSAVGSSSTLELTLEQTQKTPMQPNPQRQAQSGHVLLKLQMIICAHAECCKHTKACVFRVLWFHLKKSGSSYVVCSSRMPLQTPTLSTDVKWQSSWTREGWTPWSLDSVHPLPLRRREPFTWWYQHTEIKLDVEISVRLAAYRWQMLSLWRGRAFYRPISRLVFICSKFIFEKRERSKYLEETKRH